MRLLGFIVALVTFVVLLCFVLLPGAFGAGSPTHETLYPDSGYITFEGVRIGDETRNRGCLNWSEADLCFFVDLNCDYLFDPLAGERLMCGSGSGTCVDIGGICTINADCCTGQCVDGICVNTCNCAQCIDIGGSCTSNTECCTGQCVDGVCANGGGIQSTTSTSLTPVTTTTTTTLPPMAQAEGECYTILGAREGVDLYPWIAPASQTVTSVACHCDGQCVTPIATVALIDGTGAIISTVSTLTCGTGTGTSTYVATNAFDTDRNLTEGERLGVRVTNTPASFDEVTVCVTF